MGSVTTRFAARGAETVKVLLLTRYTRVGASSRVRSYVYLPYLCRHGIDVTIAPLLHDGYIEDLYARRRKRFHLVPVDYLRRLIWVLRSNRFDALWIEKEVFPWLPPWAEATLARLGMRYIVDFDDATFHSYDLSRNRLVRLLLAAKIDVVMRRSTLVTVGNDYLEDRARRAGARRVEYLPSVIDLNQYGETRPAEASVFTIGWIGTPVTARYLEMVQPALAEIGRRKRVRVVLVGAGPVDLQGVPVETRDWSEAREAQDIRDFHVGIMPLPDSPWERGKCGYKLIQYMACARPVVASPVGANKRIVVDGVNGLLATTTAEWVAALSTLYENRDLGVRMGRAGRLAVETHYCVQVTAPRLVSLLYQVANRTSQR